MAKCWELKVILSITEGILDVDSIKWELELLCGNLPVGLTVETLNLVYSGVDRLPAGLTIMNDLDLGDCNIEQFPDNMVVNGNVTWVSENAKHTPSWSHSVVIRGDVHFTDQ